MSSVVLRNGIALAGEEFDPTPFRELLIEDGTIAGFDVDAPRDARAIELDGAFVLPGLIDAHVHFGLTGGINPYPHWRQPLVRRGATLLRNGLIALAHGITTVRDLGSVDAAAIDYGRMTAAGELLGPRVVACGRWIAMTGGHGWEYGREADGADDVRKAVREQVRARAGVIKLMATGGLSTPGNAASLELGREELAAGVEEAHNAGLKAAAHAHAAAGIRAAVEAGIDSIEHAAFAGPDEIELMKRAGVFLVPTLVAVMHVRPGSGIDDEVVAKTEEARGLFYATVEQAIRAGVTVAAGTDAGTALNPIGLLVDELKLYASMGMTATDAIRSATVTAGRLLGLPAGVIEPGRVADLVIVRDDPRDDLDQLRRPRLVVRGGQCVDVGWAVRVVAALGREEADRLLDLGQIEEGGMTIT